MVRIPRSLVSLPSRLPLSIKVARVLDGQHSSPNILTLLGATEREEVEKDLRERQSAPPTQGIELAIFDASLFTGLRTIVHDAAIERIDDEGERSIEIPKLAELIASAAVARCLMQERLRGAEIRAIRRIMKLTLGELAKRLDDKTLSKPYRDGNQRRSRWEFTPRRFYDCSSVRSFEVMRQVLNTVLLG